jgi:YfiR/HmsC-like
MSASNRSGAVLSLATRRDERASGVSRWWRRSAWSGGACRPGPVFAGCLTFTILVVLRAVALAQDVTEPALKAAFIYHFAKFTDWPGYLPAADPIVLCVIGDPAVSEALERAVVGQMIKGHRIVTSRVAPAATKRPCHVFYVSGVSAVEAGQLLADLRDTPLLTISDVTGFTAVGGIAEFLFEDGRLRFRIQLVAVKRARLQISSRLLTLAKTK